MKIAVLGATGKAGSLIVDEALSRKYEVTAVVRDKSKLKNSDVDSIEKGVFDLIYDDLKPFEVIVDALGFWNNLELHITSTQHLLSLLHNQPNRILFVGGAGSLYVNPEHTVRLLDTPDFPDAYKPVAKAMSEAFEEIKKAEQVNWTYLSPAPKFISDGESTGSYQLGKDEVILNSQGEPAISYADYAIALVDEIEKQQFHQQRFTVVGS